MSRRIHLKCYLGDECRKIDIERQLAHSELESVLSYNFGCPVEIDKYQDHEGDLVSVNSYRDLEIAFYEYRSLETNQPTHLHALKLYLRPAGAPSTAGSSASSTPISRSGSNGFMFEPDTPPSVIATASMLNSPSGAAGGGGGSGMSYLDFHKGTPVAGSPTVAMFRPSSPVVSTKHVSISDWRSSLDHHVEPISLTASPGYSSGLVSSSSTSTSSVSSAAGSPFHNSGGAYGAVLQPLPPPGSPGGVGHVDEQQPPPPIFGRPRANSATSLRASFVSKVLPITEHHLEGERVRSTNNTGEVFPPPLRTPPPSPGRPSPTNLLLSDLSFSPSRDSPLSLAGAGGGGSGSGGGSYISHRESLSFRATTPAVGTPKRNLTGQDLWKKGTELLGKGGFGKVYLGLLQTGELIAVKEMELLALADTEYQRTLREFEQEVDLMKTLIHPNIVRYYGTSREEDCLNIYLEYVPGGSIRSLLQRFGPLSEPIVRTYTRQILMGLEYLHAHSIVHRDIKGANILVDTTGRVKLADFGCSKMIDEIASKVQAKSIKGTPYWMAPEVIRGTGHGTSADIWSLGCTIIEMLTAVTPYSKFAEPQAAMYHIASTQQPPDMPENVSSEALSFLALCFQSNPNNRPSASTLLEHPFLREVETNLQTSNEHLLQIQSFDSMKTSLLIKLSVSFLPDDLVLHIFSFLAPWDLARASAVCKKWRAIAKESVLWKSFCKTLFDCHSNSAFERMNWAQLYVNYQQDRREKRKGGKYREIAEFVGKKSVLCVQYSDRHVFVGGNNKLVRVWDLSTTTSSTSKTKGVQLAGHTGSVTCMQVDGKRVITGSSDKTMRLWTLDSTRPAAVFMGHSKPVTCLKATATRLASGAANGTVRVWDIEATIPMSTLKEHTRTITSLAFLGEARLLASSSSDGTVRVWDTRASDKRAVRVMSDHQGKVLSLDVDLHLARVLSGGADGTLRVWSLSNGKCIRLDRIADGLANPSSPSPSSSSSSSASPVGVTHVQAYNQLALCGLSDGRLVWWDPYSGTSLLEHPGAPGLRAMHEAENVLVYGTEKTVKVLSFAQ